MPDLPPYPGLPRWVKLTAALAAVLLLVVLGLMHGGVHHGPGLHGHGHGR